jgi:hypothetical protein
MGGLQNSTSRNNPVDRYPANKGYRDGISFDSTMEYNVYLFLSYLIDKYPDAFFSVKRAPERFHFRPNKWGVTAYVPDFKFNTACGLFYFEVKGFWEMRDGIKIKLMERDYPWIKMRYVDRSNYKNMKKLYSKYIPKWE